MMRGEKQGFPNLALIQLTVPMEGEYNIRIFIEFFDKSRTNGSAHGEE